MAESSGPLTGTGLSFAASTSLLPDASPRVKATMDVPLANPTYLSDAPSFIYRQKSRAVRAMVSEHVMTTTCHCRQCLKAARSQLVPKSGLPWPPSLGEWAPGGATASTATASVTLPQAPPPTATKLDEARKQIHCSREELEMGGRIGLGRGRAWREAAFRQHTCLAKLRAREVELEHIQRAIGEVGYNEDLCDSLARKQDEVRRQEEALDGLDDLPGSDGDTATKADELQTVTLQPKGFVWFLKVAAACANADEAQGRPRKDSWLPKDPSVSLEDVLGVRIPDTVVLSKVMANRRYSLDARGKVQVTTLQTSAELLRVLRDFVRKAVRARQNPDVPGSGRRSPRKGRATLLPGLAPGKFLVPRSRSEGSLRGHRNEQGSVPDVLGLGVGNVVNPMIEVAVLYYSLDEENQPDDMLRSRTQLGQTKFEDGGRRGAVRLMTYAEAIAQMKGASKLPRSFWQNIKILQTPVQSVHVGTPTRYITYNYDQALAGEIEPQEPVPLGGFPRGQGPTAQEEAARVAAVPKKLNEFLLRCKKGQSYLCLVSGLFEFVLDEADGTLWLVNASRLMLERRPEPKQKDEEGDQLRYFEEEEFEQQILLEDQQLAQSIKRFVNQDSTSVGGVPNFTLSESDRLSGVKVPEDLVTFYAARQEMTRYYSNEVLPAMERDLDMGSTVRALGDRVR